MKSRTLRVAHCARPYLWLFIGLNTAATGLISGLNVFEALLLSLSLSFLASFGFVLNDIRDRYIDGEMHPDRLGSADSTTLGLAHASMGLFLLLGLAAASLLDPRATVIALGVAVSLAAYSLVIRKILLIATITVAFTASSPLWAPFIVSGRDIPPFHLTIVFATFLLLAARETILDMKDVNGDLKDGRHTMATIAGERVSVIIVAILTSSGFLALSAAYLTRLSLVPFAGSVGMATALGVFGWVIMRPTLRIVVSKRGTSGLLDTYAVQTRRAMAIVPLLVIISSGW